MLVNPKNGVRDIYSTRVATIISLEKFTIWVIEGVPYRVDLSRSWRTQENVGRRTAATKTRKRIVAPIPTRKM